MAEKKRTLKQPSKKVSKSRFKFLGKARVAVGRGFAKIFHVGQKEYQPVKLPDSKTGRVLNKRFNIVPKYFRESWAEIRKVTWPTRSETIRLTIAVFIFSVVITVVVAVLDLGLDKIFRRLIVD